MAQIYTYEELLTSVNNNRSEFTLQPRSPVERAILKLGDISGHLQTLFLVSLLSKSKTILELGTATGESTLAFLEAAKLNGGRVFSVDIDSCLEAGEKITRFGYKDFWTFIQIDDLTLKWTQQIDLLFIDTSHTFDQTISELAKYEPLVKKGGVIMMHDIVTFPEVMDAIDSYKLGRDDLVLYRDLTNNGLGIIFKN
ncbi:MAG: class I SAM-dependent methyltransferase [Nitrososphaerota archaeon]|nr:class I SAM-dependent methyltransferase [Nitrososphaerota archaeon]